jgi:hypothetical protein
MPKIIIPFTRHTFFAAASSVLHSLSTIILDEKTNVELIDVVIAELYKTSKLHDDGSVSH